MWWRRRNREEEFKQEIDAHLALDTDRFIADGMSPEDARARAQRTFGNVTQAQERFYNSRRVAWLDGLRQDVLYASRQFRRTPAVGAVAIGSITLGIAATVIVFAFLDALVLHPLPYEGVDRMVTVSQITKTGQGRGGVPLSGDEFAVFQQLGVFDGAVAAAGWDMTLTGGELPERVFAGQLSDDAFRYFGLPPTIGRLLTAADAPASGEPRAVVVLSYRFWHRHYGGDTSVLGRTITLDSEPYAIVGVASPRFRYSNSDIYVPLRRPNDPQNLFGVEARLRPDVTLEQAEAALQPWFAQLAAQSPGRFLPDVQVRLTHVVDTRTTRFRSTFRLLFAAALLLLVVACANVAVLLLVRGTTRQHELAVRLAIGASRTRIVRQLLIESLVLAVTGGVLGIALAYRGLPVIIASLPQLFLPNDVPIQITTSVLAFSAGVTLLAAVCFGLSPALQVSKAGLFQSMQRNLLLAATSATHNRTHRVLLAGQVAVVILLLTGAGAALRTFLGLTRTPLGFNRQHLLVVNIPIAEGRYATWPARVSFIDSIRQRVGIRPDVEAVAVSFFCCPPASAGLMPMEQPDRPGEPYLPASVQQVSPSFFSTLQIPVVKGRLWSDSEHAQAAHVAVVDQRTAQQLWPQDDAIGKRIRLPQLIARQSWQVGAPRSNDPLVIVGVVGSTPNRGLSSQSWPAVYVPLTLVLGDVPRLIVRTRGDPLAMVRTIQEEVHALDPTQVVSTPTSGDEIVRAAGWGREEVVAMLFLGFSIGGLALASIGLYSVASFVVSQRAREFGIRRALGAQDRDLMWRAVRTTFLTVAIGLGVGMTLSLTIDRVAMQLTHVNTRDPLVLLVVVGLFLTVSLIASVVPARRATRIDPVVALRYE